MSEDRLSIPQLAEGDLPFCESCGAAVMPEGHRGHLMYGAWLNYRDFELILLSLGASGSDVQRLWPEAVDDDRCTYLTRPDRVIYLYDADGNELRRIEAHDATPDNTVTFPDAPLPVASVQILAAGDVYA